MEQTLLTDQDNAIIYADEAPRMRSGTRRSPSGQPRPPRAGFPECPGATWPPVAGTALRVEGALHRLDRRPEPERRPRGLDLLRLPPRPRRARPGPLEDVLGRPAKDPVPPASWRRPRSSSTRRDVLLRLKGSSSVVDLKKHAISPVVFLARTLGTYRSEARAGNARSGRRRRTGGGMESTTSAPSARRTGFVVGLRLRIQLRQLQAVGGAGQSVHLADLSAIARSR